MDVVESQQSLLRKLEGQVDKNFLQFLCSSVLIASEIHFLVAVLFVTDLDR